MKNKHRKQRRNENRALEMGTIYADTDSVHTSSQWVVELWRRRVLANMRARFGAQR